MFHDSRSTRRIMPMLTVKQRSSPGTVHGKPGTASQFQRRELVAVPALRPLCGAHTDRHFRESPILPWGKSGTNIVNVCRMVGPQGGYKLMTRVMAAALGAAVLQSTLLYGADAAPKVEELLHRMTLDEKIGQLAQIGGQAFIPGAPKPEDAVRKGAGSVLWLNQPAAINRLQKISMEETRLKIPLLFGLDVIHGFQTIFPMPLALAASWDGKLIERVQSMAAREARAAGIAWTFAPMVDIARDPRWGRIIEGAGEDPFLGSMVARAQVRGFQGDDVGQPDRVLACAKHFAGYGKADGGRDYDSSYISDSELFNVDRKSTRLNS